MYEDLLAKGIAAKAETVEGKAEIEPAASEAVAPNAPPPPSGGDPWAKNIPQLAPLLEAIGEKGALPAAEAWLEYAGASSLDELFDLGLVKEFVDALGLKRLAGASREVHPGAGTAPRDFFVNF
eukprot:26642-Prymnesium_polylepis.1